MHGTVHRFAVAAMLGGVLAAAVLTPLSAAADPSPALTYIESVVTTDTDTAPTPADTVTARISSAAGSTGFEVQLLDGPTLSDVVQTITLGVPDQHVRYVDFYGAQIGHPYDLRARSVFVVDGVTEYSEYTYWTASGFNTTGPIVPLLQVKPARDVVVRSPYSGALDVSWKAPLPDPTTAPLTGYTITVHRYVDLIEQEEQVDLSTQQCAAPCASTQFQGLRNGSLYIATVRSRSDPIELSEPAPTDLTATRWGIPVASATPYGAPIRPNKLTATRSGTRARLMWAASRAWDGGPVDSYKVYVNGKFRKTIAASRSIYTHVYMVTGIKRKKTYTFTVRAYNAHGLSSPLTITKNWK